MAGAFTNGQGNLVLSLAGQSVIMQGLKLGSLSAGDFVFYAEAIQPPSPRRSPRGSSLERRATT